MRDERCQSRGEFASGIEGAKGSLLQHERLLEFIARNYAVDAQGRCYFQNGPQRVYVELESTPWIWRVESDFTVRSHTGEQQVPNDCLVDENGFVYLLCPLGLGLVHTLDVAMVASAIEQGKWVPHEVTSSDIPSKYHFITSPRAYVAQAPVAAITAP